MKRKLLWGALAAIWALSAAEAPAEWRRPFAAHRVIGNVYYVGTYDLACFLVVTPQGNILINTGLADSAPMIRQSIADLGFKLEDVRWLLTTQAHLDHVAAMAEVKRLTGARVLASQADAVLLEDGGKSDFHFGPEYGYAPVKVDERIGDGEKLRLGGVELTAYLHAGAHPGKHVVRAHGQRRRQGISRADRQHGDHQPGRETAGQRALSGDRGGLRPDVRAAEGAGLRHLSVLARVAIRDAEVYAGGGVRSQALRGSRRLPARGRGRGKRLSAATGGRAGWQTLGRACRIWQ